MSINSRFGINKKGIIFLMLIILIFILNISFTKIIAKNNLAAKAENMNIQNNNCLDQIFAPTDKITTTFLSATNDFKQSVSSSELNITLPFFQVVYFGNGVDHMSINLVNLNSTGLQIGDEIGVFDSIYCVGSAVISEKNLISNGLSIPASANDTITDSRNGYLEGDKITLKLYRSGSIYKLNFELVNNSRDIFERWGSMFALVNFSKSNRAGQMAFSESVNLYPNPFSETICIEISTAQKQFLNCEILDLSGKIVRTLFQGEAALKIDLIWDATDYEGKQVPSGIYFCRINQSTIKIIYKSVYN